MDFISLDGTQHCVFEFLQSVIRMVEAQTCDIEALQAPLHLRFWNYK